MANVGFLDCKSCFVGYNLDERRPLVNPACGHGICRKCVVHIKVKGCPQCNVSIQNPCDNSDLIKGIEEIAQYRLKHAQQPLEGSPSKRLCVTHQDLGEFKRFMGLKFHWEYKAWPDEAKGIFLRLSSSTAWSSGASHLIDSISIFGDKKGHLSLQIRSGDWLSGKRLQECFYIWQMNIWKVVFNELNEDGSYHPRFYPPEAARIFRLLAECNQIPNADFLQNLLESKDWRTVNPQPLHEESPSKEVCAAPREGFEKLKFHWSREEWEWFSLDGETEEIRRCIDLYPKRSISFIFRIRIHGHENGTLSLRVESGGGSGDGWGKKLKKHLSVCGIEGKIDLHSCTNDDFYSPTFYASDAAKVFRFLAVYHEIPNADFLHNLLESGDWKKVTPLTAQQSYKIEFEQKTREELRKRRASLRIPNDGRG